MAVCKFKVNTVSEIELFYWFRDKISPNLLSLNELNNGVDLCLGVDMLFPGVVGNQVIEVTETGEYFRRLNFRRLRDAFLKLNITTDIPIDGLIKKSFKDILNFGMWFKAFFDANCKARPDDLNEVRASHLKKLAKKKRPYESRKTKLYAKDLKNSNLYSKDMQPYNKGDYRSIGTLLKMSIVRNTDFREMEKNAQKCANNSAAEQISAEAKEQISRTRDMIFGNDGDSKSVAKEQKQSNALKLKDTPQINISNTEKQIRGDSDGDHKTYFDQSMPESTENTDCLRNPKTDGTFDTDLTTSGPSFKKMISPVIL